MNEEHIHESIELADKSHIDELETLYDQLNDYLESNINHPGWIKHSYPTRKTAVQAIEQETLFILKRGDCIAGSIILNHNPEDAYEQIEWGIDCDYSHIMVLHTLVVHPDFMKMGIAKRIMLFAEDQCRLLGMKAIRFDTPVSNMPAINLYEKMNYTYMGTVEIDFGYVKSKWFRLYEKLLK